MNDDSFSIASPGFSPAGVSSHGRPVKRSERACSRPPFAAPPSGWPPTNVNRGGSRRAAWTTARFVLPGYEPFYLLLDDEAASPWVGTITLARLAPKDLSRLDGRLVKPAHARATLSFGPHERRARLCGRQVHDERRPGRKGSL